MGSRIHKVLGYGFDDVKFEDYKICDDRFNAIGEERDKNKEFCDWLLNNKKEAEDILKEKYGFKHPSLFLRDIKYNHNNLQIQGNTENLDDGSGVLPVLFLPIEYSKTWYRYDDILDYEEFQFSCQGAEDSVKNLFKNGSSCGIYPYNAYMYRLENKSIKIPEDEVYKSMIDSGLMAPSEYNMLLGKWSKDMEPLAKYKLTLEHLRNDWRPKIPETIILYCDYMKIFKDPLTVKQLEPMLYTYWA